MISQKRILIVDDHEDHRRILRYQLRKIGQFNILEAFDGQQALTVVSSNSLDLIFLNLGLPIVDGWEVARRIRAMPSPVRDVPLIAFTAYTMPNEEKRAMDAGCDDYLTKPMIDVALLERKVIRFLTRGRTP